MKASLIHWSPPKSPFFQPNNSSTELLQASVRASHVCHEHMYNILLGQYPENWLVSPASFLLGEYVMTFEVGTAPQDTYAVADTSSHLVWLQCSSTCKTCYKQKIPLLDNIRSKTFESLNCRTLLVKPLSGDKLGNANTTINLVSTFSYISTEL